MTTYTWNINSLTVVDHPNPQTAFMSNFTISSTQEKRTGSVTYSVNLLSADASNFIPYDKITKAHAVQWTKEALGLKRVAAMEAEVQAQIDAQAVIATKQMSKQAPLPWVPVEK